MEDTTLKQVLAGLTFSTKRIDDAGEIERVIRQYGGAMSKNMKQCDYIITPLTHEKKIKIDTKEVIIFWIIFSFNDAVHRLYLVD